MRSLLEEMKSVKLRSTDDPPPCKLLAPPEKNSNADILQRALSITRKRIVHEEDEEQPGSDNEMEFCEEHKELGKSGTS